MQFSTLSYHVAQDPMIRIHCQTYPLSGRNTVNYWRDIVFLRMNKRLGAYMRLLRTGSDRIALERFGLSPWSALFPLAAGTCTFPHGIPLSSSIEFDILLAMETQVETAAVKASSAGSSTKIAKKATKPRSKPAKASHPPTSEMVNAAIAQLKDRKGSSLQAIKKYITATYVVDGEKLAPHIRKFLKAAVLSGSILQTKGKGAAGSFKLAAGKASKPKAPRSVKKASPKKKKTIAKKSTVGEQTKKPAAPKKASPKKKTVGVAKTAATVKKVAPKAVKSKPKVAKAKSPSKAKTVKKTPTAKPKAPKAKKAAAPKAAKAAPVKK